MRLIDIEPLQKEHWHLHRYVAGVYAARVEEMELEEVPTVDAVPVKHGKWFDAMVGELPVQVCDQCNTFFPLAYTGGGHHYCPNCGAKMDLEEQKCTSTDTQL